MKSKMSTMCLIHDQRDPFFMRDIRDHTNIRNHAVISRRRDHDRPDILLLLQDACHLLRTDLPIQSCPLVKFRVHIDRMQFIQIYSIMH